MKDAAHCLFPVLMDLSEKSVVFISPEGSGREEDTKLLHMLSACTGHLKHIILSSGSGSASAEGKNPADPALRQYAREDLYGADVVFYTGTDPALLDDIFAACRTLGIQVCLTAQPSRSDFILPGKAFK